MNRTQFRHVRTHLASAWMGLFLLVVAALSCGTTAAGSDQSDPSDLPAPSEVEGSDLPAPSEVEGSDLPAPSEVEGSDLSDTPTCPHFGAGVVVGTLTWPELTEASGLAASATNPGVLWAHSDSGDTARVFALSTTGEVLGEFALAGVLAEDWEDIAVGPGPQPGVSYLYVGDVGDNPETRTEIQVVRLPEPVVQVADAPFSMVVEGAEVFRLKYPEGKSHNCETLAVDPHDSAVVLVNKTGDTFSSVFRVLLPASPPEQLLELAFVTTIPIGIATGGDFSPDGSMLLVRNYFQAFVWQRNGPAGSGDATSGDADSAEAAASLLQALNGPACPVPMVFKGLGEAVTFARDGSGYYTLSEGVGSDLYFYPSIP